MTEIEKAIIKLFGTSGAYVVLHKVGREVGVATYERCTLLSDVEEKR
ncbi:MAG: hypothetical protein ACE5PO_03285 [Candidatus Bathyarchaeia archaeon]